MWVDRKTKKLEKKAAMKQMKIIKRSGQEVAFDITKIENAIRKASQAVDYKNALSEGRIRLIAEEVAGVCEARDRAMTVEEIQDVVETKIMEMGGFEIAKKYITYRYKQSLLRQANTTDEQIMSQERLLVAVRDVLLQAVAPAT